MRVKFLDIGGVRTRYLYEGSGYPLLLIHGVGLSADSWIRNIDPLARDFFVCAPDTLGSGFTESGDYQEGPPQPHIVEHLARLVDTLGLDRFAIAGSSFGGLISALLYFKMPERVEKLIIVGSGSAFNTEAELARTLSESFQNGLTVFSNPSLETCRKRMANICYDQSSVPEELLLVQLTSYALPGAHESYERRMRGMMDLERARPYRILERLEEIRLPTLIVWGRQDLRGIHARAVEAVKRLPRAKLVTVERCGHHPHIEHSDEFNETVREFVKSES